jgi:hypothetical protein
MTEGDIMRVEADHVRHEVVIHGAYGYECRLSWAAAANLSSILREKSHEAEPQPKGKTYAPTTERARR